MKWTIHIVKQAGKTLWRIPQKDRGYILHALQEMERDHFGGDVEWLKDQPATFRRRVGNWRILFDAAAKNRVIIILDIKRRVSKTY